MILSAWVALVNRSIKHTFIWIWKRRSPPSIARTLAASATVGEVHTGCTHVPGSTAACISAYDLSFSTPFLLSENRKMLAVKSDTF